MAARNGTPSSGVADGALRSLVLLCGILVSSGCTSPSQPDAPEAPPEPGTAAIVDGTPLPLYRVAGDARVSAIGFRSDTRTIRSYDQNGMLRWSTDVPNSGTDVFGGFDFDADGWPDTGDVRWDGTGQMCGEREVKVTSIRFLSGRSGAVVPSSLPPLADICWSFPGTAPYPTHQWAVDSVLFGSTPGVLTALPYYATTGWFLRGAGGALTVEGTFHYPSVPEYDAYYRADQPSVWNPRRSHVENSHVAVGVMVPRPEERVVFFTTGRAVVYQYGPLSPDQLRADRPFVTGGRLDLSGRNYGLASSDPGDPNLITLVAGTSTQSVFIDLLHGQIAEDPWAGIERHVAVYKMATNTVDDRFFSNAYDGRQLSQYTNRVAFAPSSLIRRPSGPSRLAYNVFDAGQWTLHVSVPGGTADAATFPGLHLWDITDLDGDGVDELVASPTRWDDASGSHYFPDWSTALYRWDEASLTLSPRRSIPGLLPYIVESFNRTDHATSRGCLFPVVYTVSGRQRRLVMLDRSHRVVEEPL